MNKTNPKVYVVQGRVHKRIINQETIDRRRKHYDRRDMYRARDFYFIRQVFLDKEEALRVMQSCKRIENDSSEIWCHRLHELNWIRHARDIRTRNSNIQNSELEKYIISEVCDPNSFNVYFSEFCIREVTLGSLTASEMDNIVKNKRSLPKNIY